MRRIRYNKIALPVIAVAVVATSVAIVLWYRNQQPAQNVNLYPKAAEGKSTLPSNPTPTPGNTPGTAMATIPKSDTPKQSQTGSVVIASPTQGSTLVSGATVAGTVSTTATKLSFRLKGGKSGVLAYGSIVINGTKNVPYSFQLGFTNKVSPGGDQGELQVFTEDASGVQIETASVAVNIQG